MTNRKPTHTKHPIGVLLNSVGRLALLTAGSWIAYSYLQIEHQVPLSKAIAADQKTLAFAPTGSLNVYFDSDGEEHPMALVHSVNAAASAFEMKPLFEHYRQTRPIYALDLPGFGFSTRPKYAYLPETFVQAILTLLEDIGRPTDVVALSLGSEFAAEAARRRPDLFRSLTLISPSGFGLPRGRERASDVAPTGPAAIAYQLLTVPLWSRALFDLIATRRSIEYFLNRSFIDAPPTELVDYAYATSHQPGAEHAPLAFLSGRLFNPDSIAGIYTHVRTPTLVLYDRDAYVGFDRLLPFVNENPAWQTVRIEPSLGLPHWERPQATNVALDRFLQGLS